MIRLLGLKSGNFSGRQRKEMEMELNILTALPFKVSLQTLFQLQGSGSLSVFFHGV